MGLNTMVSCKDLCRRLGILLLVHQYIFSLILFIAENKSLFTLNSKIYTKSTRQINNFYQPTTNFTLYQKRVYYMGIKIFNNLPPYFKDISNNVRKFEISSKKFLHIYVYIYIYILPHRRIFSIQIYL
jgi:hypothetical protein